MLRLLMVIVSVPNALPETVKLWFCSKMASHSARADQLPAKAHSTPRPTVAGFYDTGGFGVSGDGRCRSGLGLSVRSTYTSAFSSYNSLLHRRNLEVPHRYYRSFVGDVI